MTITNAGSMMSVVKVLREGRAAEAHKCAGENAMVIQFADGQNLAVGFGPGHDGSSYEFGMKGHLFSISRLRFLEALKAAGFDVQKLPTE